MDDRQIRKDRLRYTKNSLSSGLALLAILFNVFYFVSIYKSDVGNYYYNWIIGVSVLYNLVFMLIVFLCSEGVKNYKKSYAFTLIVMGALQFVRILVIPVKAASATVKIGGEETAVMQPAQFTRLLVFISISGLFCISAGIVGMFKSHILNAYLKELEVKEK